MNYSPYEGIIMYLEDKLNIHIDHYKLSIVFSIIKIKKELINRYKEHDDELYIAMKKSLKEYKSLLFKIFELININPTIICDSYKNIPKIDLYIDYIDDFDYNYLNTYNTHMILIGELNNIPVLPNWYDSVNILTIHYSYNINIYLNCQYMKLDNPDQMDVICNIYNKNKNDEKNKITSWLQSNNKEKLEDLTCQMTYNYINWIEN